MLNSTVEEPAPPLRGPYLLGVLRGGRGTRPLSRPEGGRDRLVGKRGKVIPLWVDSPTNVYTRKYIPLRLLRPGETSDEIQRWYDAAEGNDLQMTRELER